MIAQLLEHQTLVYQETTGQNLAKGILLFCKGITELGASVSTKPSVRSKTAVFKKIWHKVMTLSLLTSKKSKSTQKRAFE